MRSRRRFGQHFLQPEWIRRVVEVVAPLPDDTFIEIGPGQGALTLALAARCRRVIAIEIDRDLAPTLIARAPKNVTVVNADILDVDLSPWLSADTPLRVAGNLPYNISTPILQRLMSIADDGRTVKDATVMLQREVAERLAAHPGTKAWGVLSACQQLRASVSAVLALPPSAFRPAPQVHSSVVRLTYHPPAPPTAAADEVERLVKAVFLHRRKMLSNALSGFADTLGQNPRTSLERAGIDPDRRPETLSLEELVRLSDMMHGRG
jgi:16S rRNA (adenine1518-N6/adenine1519-N6)-dimethyltransferase